MGTMLYYAGYWFVVGIITVIVNRLLPDRLISKYSHLIFRRKVNPKFYEKRLKIKSWKDKMPEMSSYDKSVFDKSSLKSMNMEYLNRYMTELDKGLFAHTFPVIFLLPIANTVSSEAIVWMNAILLSIVHLPFLAILRYNQSRMTKLLEFMTRQDERKKRKEEKQIQDIAGN